MVLEKKVLLERMTSKQVRDAIRESNGIVIIPVGATEAHGPHLPLNVDTLYTAETVMRAAKEVGVVVAPTVPWGTVQQQMGFPGSINIKYETLIALIKDIGRSLVQHGFSKLIIINGHGGNLAALDIACDELKYETGALVCNISIWELAKVPKPEGTPAIDAHGGAQEVSTTLALAPQDVDMEIAVVGKLKVDLPPNVAPWPRTAGKDSAIHLFVDAREITESGYLGDPSRGTAEHGEKVLQAWTAALVEFLHFLKEEKIVLRPA